MRRWIPELVALPILPLLVAQGIYTRRITPRLPEAAGPKSGVVEPLSDSGKGSMPLTLLTLGESPVAGVGVASHEEAITGALAQALSIRLKRSIQWQACGNNGITARQALQRLLPHIPPAPVDLALVAFGVNDSTAFRPLARWKRDMEDLLDALDERCAPSLVLLSGVPPLEHFPALPQPLRGVMGLKARLLDTALQELAQARPHICYVAVALDPTNHALMASDGYHPSAKGCAEWAKALADAGAPRMRINLQTAAIHEVRQSGVPGKAASGHR